MPTKVLKSYAEQSGKTIEEVEKAWEDCKVSANKHFKEEDPNYYAYVNMCARKKLGIKDKEKKK